MTEVAEGEITEGGQSPDKPAGEPEGTPQGSAVQVSGDLEKATQEARYHQSRADKLEAELQKYGGIESLLQDRQLLEYIAADPKVQKALEEAPAADASEAGWTDEQKAAVEFLDKRIQGIVKKVLQDEVQPHVVELRRAETERLFTEHLGKLGTEFPEYLELQEAIAKRYDEMIKDGEVSEQMMIKPTYRFVRKLYLDVLADNPERVTKMAERIVSQKAEKARNLATSKPGAPVSSEGPPEIKSVRDAVRYAAQKHGIPTA